MKQVLMSVLLLLPSTLAYGGDAEKDLIKRWYGALSTANRAEITELLSDKAKFTLKDVGTEQNKAEFIASLDEWEDALKGSTIRYKVESDTDGAVTALVCYGFPSNELFNLEVFTFETGKIVTAVQSTVGGDCAAFPK
ncbi:MAG: nuclear transport factor 2 family protein [Rhizobiaceae bacterium]